MAHCDAQHIGLVMPANDSTAYAHVGVRTQKRAHQTIPPARRRAVVARDQRRCQVPGCTNATWLDVHHLRLRSEGGLHSLENLVCVCTIALRTAAKCCSTGSLTARCALDTPTAATTEALSIHTRSICAPRSSRHCATWVSAKRKLAPPWRASKPRTGFPFPIFYAKRSRSYTAYDVEPTWAQAGVRVLAKFGSLACAVQAELGRAKSRQFREGALSPCAWTSTSRAGSAVRKRGHAHRRLCALARVILNGFGFIEW
jgi:hypothetical protein